MSCHILLAYGNVTFHQVKQQQQRGRHNASRSVAVTTTKIRIRDIIKNLTRPLYDNLICYRITVKKSDIHFLSKNYALNSVCALFPALHIAKIALKVILGYTIKPFLHAA